MVVPRVRVLAVVGTLVVLVVVAAWLLDGRRGDRGGLERRDPDGFAACQVLARWLDGGGTSTNFAAARDAAPHAQRAGTAEIRATVTGVADVPRSPGTSLDFDGIPLVDLRRLHAACRAAGVSLRPYPA